MSVPRPAMFVATVIRPWPPASETMSASWAVWAALRTRWTRPAAVRRRLISSLLATLRVPTRTGTPRSFSSHTRATAASNLASAVSNMRVGSWTRMHGRLVGMRTMGRW